MIDNEYRFKEGTILLLHTPDPEANVIKGMTGIVTTKDAMYGLSKDENGFNVEIKDKIWRISDSGYYIIKEYFTEPDDCYTLSPQGEDRVLSYIEDLKKERKKILDAGLDTADDTEFPTKDDILSDINFWGVDEKGEYINGWGVTDCFDSDAPLLLIAGRDLWLKNG